MAAAPAFSSELLGVRGHERADIRMVLAAINNGYPISEEMRRMLVTQMALIVGRSGDERNKIGAAKVLLAADMVNVARERLALDASRPDPAAAASAGAAFGAAAAVHTMFAKPKAAELLCGLTDDVGRIESGPGGGAGGVDPGGPGDSGREGEVQAPPAPLDAQSQADPTSNGRH